MTEHVLAVGIDPAKRTHHAVAVLYPDKVVLDTPVNRIVPVDSSLDYTVVESPALGSVLVVDHGELRHVAPDRPSAETWLQQHRYPGAVLEEVEAPPAPPAPKPPEPITVDPASLRVGFASVPATQAFLDTVRRAVEDGTLAEFVDAFGALVARCAPPPEPDAWHRLVLLAPSGADNLLERHHDRRTGPQGWEQLERGGFLYRDRQFSIHT